MCGIAAIVSLSGRPVVDAERRIAAMTAALRHRGPDRQGIAVSDDRLVALGNTRLAIVDVGNDFPVPMRTRNGGAMLSYNGEIFNFADELARLEGRGVKFATRSDTEVMLHGLVLESPAFLERLDGFWSFVLYEPDRRAVTIGRDLLGEKHVFYRIQDNELILASEIPPILLASSGAETLDFDAVASAFRSRAAPPAKTLLQGVFRLEAGTNMTVTAGAPGISTARGRRLQPEKWFDFFAADPSEDEVLDLFDRHIADACRMRVPAEVDFQATLSGGIDSTLVNVFARDQAGEPLDSLYGSTSRTPPARGNDLDELSASRLTAERLDNRHEVIDLIGSDCVPLYHQQARNSLDGLFCEGVVAYQQLARHTAGTGRRVLIMSDGPDELIGGYDVDIAAFRLEREMAAHPVRRWAANWLTEETWRHRLIPKGKRKHLVNWSHLKDDPFAFRPVHGGTTPDVMETLFPRDQVASSRSAFGGIPDDYAALAGDLDLSQCMALSYATSSLPDYFNLRSDRGTMSESLEVRLPFQSPALVDLMIATPAKWRFMGGRWSKYILRKLVARHVGPEIAYRGKYGFAYPAWSIPELADQIDMPGTIAGSSVFEDLPFNPGTRDFLMRPDQQRHQWMGYCLALIHDRLREGEPAANDDVLASIMCDDVAGAA